MLQTLAPLVPETGAEDLIREIRTSIIGEGAALDGPFGLRRMVYADFAASGRAVSFIEDYVRDEVLPYYANTHTEASGAGRRTTRLREEARHAIGAAVGAGSEDVVLFCGSGSTAAIDKLVRVLNLRIPRELDARYDLSRHVPLEARPVVFIGPYEHHSNELAWRESLATVVVIPEDEAGRIDSSALERALRQHAARPLKIGSFSAASNVTGLLSDVRGLTALLHRHGALAFWDYAAAAPYVPIDMNPRQANLAPELTALDAIFVSPHKFAGGPSTPGLLIAKRRLFENRVPTVPAGGTIAYVNADVQRYAPDIASREEGGTPAIVEAIRAALVFELKAAVGEATILAREESFVRRALVSLRGSPKVVVLGNTDAPRVPIVSFLIRHRDGFLHHHFVVRLLSDLFGIQARSGCSCAGPYGHALLGVGPAASRGFDELASAGYLGIKPGWARLTFSYFSSEAAFEYVLSAVHFLAQHAHRFLPAYAFDPKTGAFAHVAELPTPVHAKGGLFRTVRRSAGPPLTLPEAVLPSYLARAEALLGEVQRLAPRGVEPVRPAAFEELRWFPLAGDVPKPPTQHPRGRPIQPRQSAGVAARPSDAATDGAL